LTCTFARDLLRNVNADDAVINGLPVQPADFPVEHDWAVMRRGGRRLILLRESLAGPERAAVIERARCATASSAAR
jgi:hypothetical protein